MRTIVVITDASPDASDIALALRHRQIRCIVRPHACSPREVARLGPDAIVIDIDWNHPVDMSTEPFQQDAGLIHVPILVVVEENQAEEASASTLIADWLMRPIRRPELLARINSRKHQPEETAHEKLSFSGLLIDLEGYEASVGGGRVDLTYQEFELLKFLASHPGKAFTREQLLTRVWGYEGYGGSRTVDIHVRRIRAKLGHPYAGWLRTIRHVGYKWVTDSAETPLQVGAQA